MNEGFCDLNIGTAGQLANLYMTKDPTYGEKLTALESVQSYNKTITDINFGKEFSRKVITKINNTINENLKSRHLEMPRDINGFVLSNNFGRSEINDVHLFYNKAFNDPKWVSEYIKSYKGPHAGELLDINKAKMPGISTGYDDEYETMGSLKIGTNTGVWYIVKGEPGDEITTLYPNNRFYIRVTEEDGTVHVYEYRNGKVTEAM